MHHYAFLISEKDIKWHLYHGTFLLPPLANHQLMAWEVGLLLKELFGIVLKPGRADIVRNAKELFDVVQKYTSILLWY